MSFALLFKAFSFCLITSGFVAFAATGTIGLFSTVLFSAVLICGWFLDTGRIKRRIPRWVLRFSPAAYIPVFIVDYQFLSRSLEIAVFHLILFMAAVKLLTLSKDRDYLVLYLISFTELLAAATRTVDLVFAICFVVFLFSATGTLVLFEMRRSNAQLQKEASVRPLVLPEELRGTGMELFAPFPAGMMALAVSGITLLVIAVSIPLFFLLPRVTMGSYRQPYGKTQMTSGFSERVELGQIGSIKQSDAIVMRVKTDKPFSELPADLKWRGLAFDYYDGRGWMRRDMRRHAIPTQGWYYKIENYAQGTNLINQTFFVEALSTDVVFASHKVLAVSKDAGPLRADSSGNLYTARHMFNKLRYSAVSNTVRPVVAEISDLRPIPQEIVRRYTQVPALDQRIKELAERVTKDAGDRYAKAKALERHLLSEYAYSLVLRGSPKNRDPLAMFLFDVKKGHCEYFASAMAIMLRQLGIPARVVNGFRRGEYNKIGDSWTVRQYDAHSWVEAYFPPYGWIEFDPTPPDPERPKTALGRMIADLTDAIDLWWWESVVNYDSAKQYRALSAIQNRLSGFQESIRRAAESGFARVREAIGRFEFPIFSPSASIGWIGRIAVIAVAALLLTSPVRKRVLRMIRKIHAEDPRVRAMDLYEDALALLRAHGMRRSPDQTTIEFAQSLGGHPAAGPFLALTRMYNAVRFGSQGAAAFRRHEAEALLERMDRDLNRHHRFHPREPRRPRRLSC